jgi:hypothetical protein
MGRDPSPNTHPPDRLHELVDEKSLADEISNVIEGKECPGEAEVLAYLEGGMDEAARAELRAHAQSCRACAIRLKAPEAARGGPVQERGKGDVGSGGFRGFRIAPRSLAKKAKPTRPVLLAVAVAASVAVATFLIIGLFSREPPCSGMLAGANGTTHFHAGQKYYFTLRTHSPIHVVEVIIEGDGSARANIPAGPADGTFRNGDAIEIIPRAPGELDLYLAPVQVEGESPEKVLAGLRKLIGSGAADRQEQRRAIEMAFGLYQVRFIHQVHRIET